MRILTALSPLTALSVLLLWAAPPARAGEPTDAATATAGKSTVEVVVVMPDGKTLEGTLIGGTKDGSITVKSPYGEQTFARSDWVEVRPKAKPRGLSVADEMMSSKRYDSAAQQYQKVYDDYEHLYVFGAEALDGKGQALMKLKRYRQALAVYNQLVKEYSGADLSYARRYHYAVSLSSVGGKSNDEKAVDELNAIVAATDDALTVRSLYQLGRIHYGNEQYELALRAFLQVYILYRNYRGADVQRVQTLVASAKSNAVVCAKALVKTTGGAAKRRYSKLIDRLQRTD